MSLENILEVSGNGISLTLFRGFVIISKEGAEIGRKAFNEFSCLLIASNGVNLTTNLLNRLIEEKIPVLICNEKFEVSGILSPTAPHSFFRERLEWQLNASVAFKKQVWQKVVKEKILNQASVLRQFQKNDESLQMLAKNILSGDSGGAEAQAAKIYFKQLFGQDFIRNTEFAGQNAMLNYGYAVLRSCVVRSIFASGLLPALGIFHKNKENPFCLADDFIEAFRPAVDFLVKSLPKTEELTPEIKKELVKVLMLEVECEEGVYTTANGILKAVQSYVKALETQNSKAISFPKLLFSTLG